MNATPSPIPGRAPASVHTLHGETMGTTWSVKLVASPRADLHAFHAGIQAKLDLVVAQMSTWEVDSDICRFNRAPAGTWQVLPSEFFSVLTCALDTARASAGAYDPTVGPLVEAWGFGSTGNTNSIPSASALVAARQHVGWNKVQLRPDSGAALQPGGIALDLSAIAKGYAVDLVAQYLRHIVIDAALIEVGGELYGYGHKPDGSSWQVLVEASPEATDEETCVLALDGLAVATSGDRWHAFEQHGQIYAHTIDPRSGAPVRHAPAAVTVIAADAMHADAWATALTVMGVEEGFAFAEERNLAVRFVARGDDSDIARMTESFRVHLAA
jgi:thiamine biosynthesis lipoprotein